MSGATGDPDLGDRLRSLRKAKGLALKAVSAQAGISLPFLSEVERGQKLPTLNVLVKLATALDTSVVGVLSGLPRYGPARPLSVPKSEGESSR